MLISEEKPPASNPVFRVVREQIRKNKKSPHYVNNKWDVENSGIEQYEISFGPVLEGKKIADLLKKKPPPVTVVDLMSSSDSALVSLFKQIPVTPKLGISHSLSDKRTEEIKKRDERLGIKQVHGDLMLRGVWQRIEKELNGKKADLIMERGLGGLDFLPKNESWYAFAISNAWKLLSDQGGTLLLQVTYDWIFKREAMRIEKWVEYLNDNKIESVYIPRANCPGLGSFNGILKLIKTPDSPQNLPFLS